MRWFYDENIAGNSKEHLLNEDESAHILRVLRMQIGEEIAVVNGKGSLFNARIIGKEGKRCEISIIDEEFHEMEASEIHVAIAPTKQLERMEWFIEKATEIGVTHISFIQTKNSERTKLNIDRLIKKAISALKQSRRFYLPIIEGPINFQIFVSQNQGGLIAHCYEGEKFNLEKTWKNNNCPIIIGPEGDFTPEEIEIAQQNQFKSVTLGTNRLRTETAGLYVCMQAKMLSE